MESEETFQLSFQYAVINQQLGKKQAMPDKVLLTQTRYKVTPWLLFPPNEVMYRGPNQHLWISLYFHSST